MIERKVLGKVAVEEASSWGEGEEVACTMVEGVASSSSVVVPGSR